MKIVFKDRFDGVANKTTYEYIKQLLEMGGDYAVELTENKRIVMLNIPHGELFCKCSKEQWEDLMKII